MSRGKRYNGEKKLNMKKVFAVIMVIVVIIAIIFGIQRILKADEQIKASKNIELNYFSVYSNGNWGVINSSGETIIQPAYAEMIIVPNKAKPVFICTYEVNYVDGTYKTKAINEKNEEIYTGYENILVLQNYDENNNLWFEENVLKVQKEGKFGLIGINGNEILPCEYDSITTMKGIKNSIIVKKDGNVGIVNSDGSIIVPVQFAEVEVMNFNYENGYRVKNAEGKYGVIKSNGQTALECKYEDVKLITHNDLYIAKLDGTWKVTTTDDITYLDGKVGNAIEITNGNVVVKDNGKFGVLNIQTDTLIPTEYQDLTHIFDGNYIAKKDNKYGIINSNNETVVEFKYLNMKYNKTTDYIKAEVESGVYDYITRDLSVKLTSSEETILNGHICINNNGQIKYYNYNLEEKSNKDVFSTNTLFVTISNGKYGFVDKEGKVIVEAKYDYALEQNDYGYSAIRQDGKWGAIDQYGNIVIEPTYVLDNNAVIDFIGKWHSTVDSNVSYYTDAN